MAAALFAGGCVSWTPAPGSPRDVIEAERPRGVRVTDAEGARTTVWEPELDGDTLRGSDPRIRIALEDAMALEVADTSAARGVGVVGLVALGAFALTMIVVNRSWGPG